jgi:hypothetical protein
MRLHPDLFRRHIKSRRAAQIIAIHQRNRGMPQIRTPLHQILRQRSARQKAECGTSMEINKHEKSEVRSQNKTREALPHSDF